MKAFYYIETPGRRWLSLTVSSAMKLAVGFFSVLVALPLYASAPTTPAVDLVVIEKASRTLKVFSAGQEIASFSVALGRESGKKECEGDNKTPEGIYKVTGRKADSGYHRALRLSYPSPEDSKNAKEKGCSPGGDIMIHGVRNGLGWLGRFHTTMDWTRGCIAVTDEEVEELWKLVPDGTKVEIRP